LRPNHLLGRVRAYQGNAHVICLRLPTCLPPQPVSIPAGNHLWTLPSTAVACGTCRRPELPQRGAPPPQLPRLVVIYLFIFKKLHYSHTALQEGHDEPLRSPRGFKEAQVTLGTPALTMYKQMTACPATPGYLAYSPLLPPSPSLALPCNFIETPTLLASR